MKTQFQKYTLQGNHSAEEAHRALADFAPQGTIVRIDSGAGQTDIYVAGGAASAASPEASGTKKTPPDFKAQEVSESDITKFG
jgi:hypothetical protein